MSKLIQTDKTRDVVIETVEQIEELVCSTMGPDGQNIALHNGTGSPMITKDGVTVAEAIDFEEPDKKLIADILKEAARKTNLIAGDGTTTSTCIAAAVARVFNRSVSAGEKPSVIKNRIFNYRDLIATELEKIRVDVKSQSKEAIGDILYKIAMISTNGDQEISKEIAEAVLEAGTDGLINVKNTYGDASWERADGIKLPNARFAHAEFARGTADQSVTLNKCRILLTTYDLEDPNFINELNENVLKPIRSAGESIMIVGKSGKSFLENMINFNATGQFKNCVVQPPYFGEVGREMLDDIAAYTGAKIIDQSRGHSFTAVTIDHLGYAEKAVVTKEHTTLFGATTDKEEMDKRLAILVEAHDKLRTGQRDDRKIKERLASLSGNVFILNVPKRSNIEDGERLDRVEDAINACKGALSDGYVPGGGTALVYACEEASHKIDDSMAAKALMEICEAPMRKILSNAGQNFDVVIRDLSYDELPKAYDARTKEIGEALEIGVIDSYKVILNAFKNGLSIGTTLMTCNGIIANKPQEYNPMMDMY